MAEVKVLEDKFSREELNEFAASKGVEAPEKMANKTEVAEALSPLVSPEEVDAFENRDSGGEGDDSEGAENESTTTANDTASQDQFEDAAQVGHDTAKENIAAEAEQNTSEPGEDNVDFDAKTPDAEPGLKAEGDGFPKTDVLGDDKAAQKADYGIKVGQATAKKNFASSDEEQGVALGEGEGQDPVAEGRATAEKNLAAEKKAAN